MPRWLLSDLDGVLRRFELARGAALEQQHGLPAGALAAAAFGSPALHAAITGRCTRAAWVAAAGQTLGAPAAIHAFLADDGQVDAEVLALLGAVQQAGGRVGLLTNATDTLPAELGRLGLAGRLDAVISSHMLGVCKPEPGLFAAVQLMLGCVADEVAFVDDQAANVAAAQAAGWRAVQFTTPTALTAWLRAEGLLPQP